MSYFYIKMLHFYSFGTFFVVFNGKFWTFLSISYDIPYSIFVRRSESFPSRI